MMQDSGSAEHNPLDDLPEAVPDHSPESVRLGYVVEGELRVIWAEPGTILYAFLRLEQAMMALFQQQYVMQDAIRKVFSEMLTAKIHLVDLLTDDERAAVRSSRW